MEEDKKEQITPKEQTTQEDLNSVHNSEKQEQTTVEQNPVSKEEITPVPNTEIIVNVPNKASKVPRRKKDHSIKFTRTEEKISEEDEIQIEESEVHDTMRDTEKGCCGPKKGPHVTFLSVLFIPCALISSLCVAFYYGAWTWYNLYIYFSEEKTIWHKVSICPLLILTFPFTVGLTSLAIAIFAAFIQLSWYFRSWKLEIIDFDKRFYGWLCDKLGLSQCSPYEMVTLNDDSELENLPIRS